MEDKRGDKRDERDEKDAKKPGQERAGLEKMTPTERMAGGDYARLDAQREDLPVGARGDGLPSSVMNPAFYPKNLKPEAQHTEAEKAGAEWPGTKDDKKAFDDAKMDVSGPSRILPPPQG